MSQRLTPALWKQLLARTSGEHRSLQGRIREMLVGAIVDGQLPPHTPVPSSREMAEQLGVARNTVVLAYQLLGALTRGAALWRNLHRPGTSTRQTALGLRHPRIVQISQGAMGGMFQTREFFHGAAPATLTQVRLAAALLGFGLPMVAWLLLAAGSTPSGAASALPVLPALAAVLAQMLGLLAERWSFFTEGQHTQNHDHAPMARTAGARG